MNRDETNRDETNRVPNETRTEMNHVPKRVAQRMSESSSIASAVRIGRWHICIFIAYIEIRFRFNYS